MSAALAEAPVVARGHLWPNWATAATATIERDMVNLPTTSDLGRRPEWGIFAVIPYAGLRSRSLPPRAGIAVLFEGEIEQVGYAEDAVASSALIPHFGAVSVRASRCGYPSYHPLLASPGYGDEILDWDAVVEVKPMRAFGTVAVTLEYAGRGVPLPFDGPWDD
jgi:hypothetical protein